MFDDDSNKNVFYCGHVAFSYTGLAYIEGKRTDDWLLSVLPESFETWLTVLRGKSTEAFKNIRIPLKYGQLKRHAFVGVGWLRANPDGPLCPALVLISNFYGTRGELLDSVSDEFNVFGLRLSDRNKFMIFPVGQKIAQEELKHLHRNIKTCIERNTGPITMLRHLVNTMRNVANDNPSVGKNLLVLGMPKVAAGNPGMVYPFVEDKMNTFFYIPANSRKQVAYGPSIKCRGLTVAHLEMR
ncbi:MAG: hypothetical protein R6U93_04655 [Dehalococcoidia bacterium]